MSRSSGEFPKYTRLKLDPQKQPYDYWRCSRECPKCETRWPSHDFWTSCPIDGELTKPIVEAPSMTWWAAVKELLNSEFDRLYEDWNEGKSDVELAWTPSEELGPDSDLVVEHFRIEVENAKLDTLDHE